MQDEYYYSGSGFYEESDASNLNASFTDVSDVPCSLDGYSSKRARRYGQWWTLTGVTPDCQHPADAQRRLRQLYAQVVTLNHPNITRTVAMTQTPLFDDECVVEEYIDGMTLGEFMQSRPDEATCHRLLEQVIDALQYSHHKGVTHCNLSQASVIVTHQDNIAKLVAFRCEGDPSADISALGDIIDVLRLQSLNSVANACRNGKITTIDGVKKAITGGDSRKWLPKAAFLLIIAMLAAVAFWMGHNVTMQRDNQFADSLPLPGIYFSDTVRLSAMKETDSASLFHSTLTGASIYYYNIELNPPGPISEDVAIDLGLSVRWAPFNLGCDDADVNQFGSFYMWCDTLGVGRFAPVDKYWPSDSPMMDISGTQHDIVHRVWGGGWRMPTYEEWKELLFKSKWTLLKQHGIPPGYKVRGPNGAEIFLPLAGYRLRYRAHDLGIIGHYWSSTPADGFDRQAYSIYIDTVLVNIDDVMPLTHCLSIRPVLDK